MAFVKCVGKTVAPLLLIFLNNNFVPCLKITGLIAAVYQYSFHFLWNLSFQVSPKCIEPKVLFYYFK